MHLYMQWSQSEISILKYVFKCSRTRGVTVRVSCIERFTGKFQMEVIILIPLE